MKYIRVQSDIVSGNITLMRAKQRNKTNAFISYPLANGFYFRSCAYIVFTACTSRTYWMKDTEFVYGAIRRTKIKLTDTDCETSGASCKADMALGSKRVEQPYFVWMDSNVIFHLIIIGCYFPLPSFRYLCLFISFSPCSWFWLLHFAFILVSIFSSNSYASNVIDMGTTIKCYAFNSLCMQQFICYQFIISLVPLSAWYGDHKLNKRITIIIGINNCWYCFDVVSVTDHYQSLTIIWL